jgi:hypothetical protein
MSFEELKAQIQILKKQKVVEPIDEVIKTVQEAIDTQHPLAVINEKKGFDDIPRAVVIENILKSIQTNFNHYRQQDKRHQDWRATSLFNGSGSGKTYLSINLHELVDDYLQRNPTQFAEIKEALSSSCVLRVFHKQFNGSQMPADETDYDFFLLLTIASQLLHSKQEKDQPIKTVNQQHLRDIINKKNLRSLFKDKTLVFSAVKKVQGLNQDDKLWIYFGHDEMHEFTSLIELRKVQESQIDKKETKIYEYLFAALELAAPLSMRTISTFICNTFSGTFPLESTQLLVTTQYSFDNIPLTPMKPSDGILALKKKYPNCEALSSELFCRFFELCGNIPRVWVIVGEIVKDYKSFGQKEMLLLLDATRKEIEKAYKLLATFVTGFDYTLFVMIQRWNLVDVSTRQEILNLKKHVYQLLFNGCLFSDAEGQLFVPIIFLHEVARHRSYASPEHAIFVNYMIDAIKGNFDAISFKKFILYLFALRQQLFLRFKWTRPSIRDFFPGADMTDTTAIDVLDLGTIPVRIEMVHHSAITDLQQVSLHRGTSEVIIDTTNPEFSWAIHVGYQDSHQDAFILVPKNFLMLFEIKFIIEQKTLEGKTTSSIQHEINMMNKSPLRKGFGYPIYNVYFTNAKVSEKVLLDGNILVSQSEWHDALSSVFVFLRDYL